MDVPWVFHGLALVVPWLCYDCAIVELWLCVGCTLVGPWLNHGCALVVPFASFAFPAFPWSGARLSLAGGPGGGGGLC